MAQKHQPDVQIKQQNRKSFAMRVTPDGEVLVLIPRGIKPNNRHVKQFIQEGLQKLDPYIPRMKPQPLHDADIIRDCVNHWAKRIGVQVGRIQFRAMTRKWGSCSGRGNITLNTALFFVPKHLVEYVVVHELVHILILNHSPSFWAKLGECLPDYASRERELDQYRV